ncbi:MAG: putative sulfate exporter family transporter [Rhodospirillales bacterium]|nr:putative sulfate exporter family transporter [Acetobacter sp.]
MSILPAYDASAQPPVQPAAPAPQTVHPDPTRLPLVVRRTIFIGAAAFCLTPWASPAVALTLGAALALSHGNPFARYGKDVSATLLQVCVVLLGFGMDLPVVLRAGASGAGFAASTIAATLALGWWLGRVLGILPTTSALISAGTAICGGSAIAAVGSVIGVAEEEITVAFGTVFILNAVALYSFPFFGRALHLSQAQFGMWAGVAIHDISSVVGATSRYGLEALQTATAVKLSRALWIVPVTFGAAHAFRPGKKSVSHADAAPAGKPKIRVPWFVGFFLLASVLRSCVPTIAAVVPMLSHVATAGLTLTLFLIGAGLSAQTLRSVGWRPLLQGALLWVFISIASLGIIVRFV